MNFRRINYKSLLFIPIPCIVIGSICMYINNIPSNVWSLNVIIFVFMLLASFVILKFDITSINASRLGIVLSVILLLSTFLSKGLQGVHRWVSVGPINLNIAMICLPIITIGIYNIKNWWIAYTISIATSLILVFQPDASQNTAFVLSIAILLVSKSIKRLIYIPFILLLITSPIYLWLKLDSLPPVNYVEGILSMLSQQGLVWIVLGVIALIILSVPFLYFSITKRNIIYLSLFIYINIEILSSLSGNFPVPIIGYGISPIIGYFTCILFLIANESKNHTLNRIFI